MTDDQLKIIKERTHRASQLIRDIAETEKLLDCLKAPKVIQIGLGPSPPHATSYIAFGGDASTYPIHSSFAEELRLAIIRQILDLKERKEEELELL